MGFFDLFRPKWQHSNPEVRQAAVRALGDGDEGTIAKVARSDKDAQIRRIAIKKLSDPDVLGAIAGDDPDEGIRKMAAQMAADLLVGRAVKGGEAGRAALGKITDEEHLVEVARGTEDAAVRREALGRLKDPAQLVAVARAAKDHEVREAALGRITDQKALVEIALGETHREVSVSVVARIRDVEALDRIAQNAKNKAVRKAARSKLDAVPAEEKPAAPEPSPAARREARQRQLIKAAERLIGRADAAGAESEVAELRGAWNELLPLASGEAELGQRWEVAWKRLEERRAMHEAAQRARAEEVERQAREEAERQSLVERIEAWKPGEGAQAQLGEIRTAWQKLSGPGHHVPRPLSERFRRALDRATEQLGDMAAAEKARARDEARRRRDEEKAEARRIRTEEQARTDAMRAEEKKKRDEERQKADEEKQKHAAENLPKAEELCLQVEGLVNNEDTKQVDKDLKAAVAAFNDLALPKVEGQALRDRFQAARDKVVARVRELHEARDWERWANVAKLEALCTRVEKLREVEDVKKLAAELKLAQADWKKVGPAPKEKSAALWQRFKTTCDELYKKCQEHFTQLDAERQENQKKKQALVEQVEALAASEEWKDAGEKIKQLQAEWKGIGPVPKAEADALWKRFRAACDRFFERRKEHFGQLDEERTKNLKRKEELCQDAEKVASSPDWRESMKVVRQLQADWKQVGPVPKAQSDALWQRFRAACDKVFEAARSAQATSAAPKADEGTHKDAQEVQNQWRPATLADLLKPRAAATTTPSTPGESGGGKPEPSQG